MSITSFSSAAYFSIQAKAIVFGVLAKAVVTIRHSAFRRRSSAYRRGGVVSGLAFKAFGEARGGVVRDGFNR